MAVAINGSGTITGVTLGSVTSVATSTGLTGGPITTSGTISLNTTGGGLGTYILAQYSAGGTLGTTASGGTLYPCAIDAVTNGSLSGTWQCMGYARNLGGASSCTLWMRIA